MPVDAHKDERLGDMIRELAARFLQAESNRTSLITVTHVTVFDKGKQATIYITVMPEDKEAMALDFAKRMRGEFRQYVLSHSKIGRIPFFNFELDLGEKTRQKLDILTHLNKQPTTNNLPQD